MQAALRAPKSTHVVVRLDWQPVIERAAEIVDSYDTPVTLRQLFYRLVAEQLVPNKQTAYATLSSKTAQARRQGAFPDLVDQNREIHRPEHFADIAAAVNALMDWYRLDRTEGQDVSIYLAVEKRGLVEQLSSWFGALGIPVLALGGYAGQSYVDRVRNDVMQDGRPAVLLYAGDFDASGEDIDRDFVDRTDCWSRVERVALTAAQVDTYALPPNPGKTTDTRAAGFVARHGQLVQVEVDALPPDELRRLFQQALAQWWDEATYRRVLRREERQRGHLRKLLDVKADRT